MANVKFLDYTGLSKLVEKIKNTYAKINHTHTKADITDFNTVVEWDTEPESLSTTNILVMQSGKTTITPLEAGDLGQVLKCRVSGVPYWGDIELPLAKSSTVGGIKSATTDSRNDRTYNIYVDSSGIGYVKVPWVNTTYSAATSSTLGLVKTGDNITNSSGTISLTKTNITSALGYTPPTTNTTYSAATKTKAGLMSATDKTKLDTIQGVDSTTLISTLDTNTYSNSMNWGPIEDTLVTLKQVMYLYNKLFVPVYDAEDISDNGCENYTDGKMRIDLQNDILEIFLCYNSTGNLPTPNMFKVGGNLFTLMGKCNTREEEPIYRGYFFDGMQSYIPYIAYVSTEDGTSYSMNFVPEEQAVSEGVFDNPTPLDLKYKLENDWG